jgi:TAT (twin-arginine translocation) pathway signal sequence
MKVGKADREMSRRDFLKLGIAGSMAAVLLFATGCLGGGEDGDDEDDDDGGRRRGRRRRR